MNSPSFDFKRITPRLWDASWIWPRDRREPNLHLLFRKDFEVGEVPDAAIIYIAVESLAQVFLNGQELGRTAANSYPGQHYYEEFDCQPALVAGRNQLAIVASYIGIPASASVPKDPGLLCEIVLSGTNGSQSIGSDASWKCLPLEAWLGRQRRSEWLNLNIVEMVDRRLLPSGFPYPSDLSGFEEPESLRWPGVRYPGLEPRPFAKALPCGTAQLNVLKAGTVIDKSAEQSIPALAVSAELIEPQEFKWDGSSTFSIPAQAAGKAFTVLFGLDNYYSGRPELIVTGPAGAVIDISWHEKLTEGRFDVRESRTYTTDRFILAQGENRIVQEDWITGRYLQFTFRNLTAPLQVHRLRYEREEYPLQQRMVIQSSDARLNRIVELSLQAVRRCMHDNIMDCPWRERRQWIGDVQRIAMINYFAFGDRELVRGVLRQHRHLQDATGRLWVCVPIWEEFPIQSMEWLRAVLEYDHYTGDQTLLAEVFDNAEMLHRWFLRNRDARGLLVFSSQPLCNWMNTPKPLMPSWQYNIPFLIPNLRYLLFLDDMAACFRRMGRHEDEARTVQERHQLAARIREHFTDAETGLLRDCPDVGPAYPPQTFSEMGHALAICTGLLPPDDGEKFWDRYVGMLKARPDEACSATTPYEKYHTHQALALMGRCDAIIEDILKYWGPMADSDSVTTWENLDGKASQCHGWGGIPLSSIAGHVLGLDPRYPGKARKTDTGSVNWIAAEIQERSRFVMPHI